MATAIVTGVAPLSPQERAALRARAHALKPVAMIGQAGITEAVLAELDRALEAHELVKIRVLGDDRDERALVLESVCDALRAAPVQHIGRMLVLYRERRDPPELEPAAPPARRRGAEAPASKSRSAGAAVSRARGSGTPASKAHDARAPASKARDAKAPASKTRDSRDPARKTRDTRTLYSKSRGADDPASEPRGRGARGGPSDRARVPAESVRTGSARASGRADVGRGSARDPGAVPVSRRRASADGTGTTAASPAGQRRRRPSGAIDPSPPTPPKGRADGRRPAPAPTQTTRRRRAR